MTRQTRRGLLLAGFLTALVAYPIVRAQQAPAPPVETQVPTVEVADTLPSPPAPDEPSLTAVPTQEVPSPAAPSNAQESIMWGLLAAYALQYLKQTRWFSFLTEESTTRAKAIAGFISAVLTTAGIQLAVTGSPLDASGASISLTGITLIGLKDVLFQWGFQQSAYDVVIHPRASQAGSAVPSAPKPVEV